MTDFKKYNKIVVVNSEMKHRFETLPTMIRSYSSSIYRSSIKYLLQVTLTWDKTLVSFILLAIFYITCYLFVDIWHLLRNAWMTPLTFKMESKIWLCIPPFPHPFPLENKICSNYTHVIYKPNDQYRRNADCWEKRYSWNTWN